MIRVGRMIRSRSRSALAIAAALMLTAWLPAMGVNAAASHSALSGRVTSPGGAPIEGVIVSAARLRSTITFSVVSDRTGHYDFAASRIGPGRYELAVRAVGYALSGPRQVTVRRGRTTTADLSLRSVADTDDQLTNADWLLSMPGNVQQKDLLLNCTTCHTLERIVTSRFTAQDFMGVMHQMSLFANQSFDLNPQMRLKMTKSQEGTWGTGKQTLAKFMASVNESASGKLDYPLKSLPRPSGAGTDVIYTTYALPQPSIQPHDVAVDRWGRVWFSDFGGDNLGELDPRTGKVTEYPFPTTRPKEPKGALDLEFDQQGNLWIARMNQGGVAEFNYKTHAFKVYEVPKPFRTLATQQPMVAPEHWEVDGKVWMSDESLPGVYRVNIRTGHWRRWLPYGTMKGGGGGEYAFGRPHSVYGIYADKHNNLFFC
ncbi:MAG TPA: carboxypeptidase regulatory-like domain-containing protein, partial [Pseudonocardiaceae bacterium]|nr:carboxypeptidase regulatory-like domain-containing protein [Pseudonocardiaceae bacterium]